MKKAMLFLLTIGMLVAFSAPLLGRESAPQSPDIHAVYELN
jgi:hypothetical protein